MAPARSLTASLRVGRLPTMSLTIEGQTTAKSRSRGELSLRRRNTSGPHRRSRAGERAFDSCRTGRVGLIA